ncbi:MAG TPA: RsmE family RNA methyltransferase [Terriglobales bacterium]|nr:RsmE family RNA methyltransferase [Terriglobales bacterium]
MTRRRWIADEVAGSRAALTGARARHLARVLRARVGQEFDVVAGERVHRARVTRVSEDRVEFDLGEELPQVATTGVTVLLAVFKFDRMEWAIEKLTELGAARVVPVIAQRTDAHLARAAVKRAERWRRIARQAAQQSRRTSAPEVEEPLPLPDALAERSGCRIVLAETEHGQTLKEALRGTDAVTLAVGPEGGWTEAELRRFSDAGWTAASLGARILRAETAAIAALAVVQAELG